MEELALVRLMWTACAVMIITGTVHGKDYFVSPQGSDVARGSKEQPFATISKACNVLQPGDRCYLREGVYREVLRPARSGSAEKLIIFANYKGERVVISGADRVTGWRHEGDGVYSAPMPWNWADGNQVFADGRMLTEACWPNSGSSLLQPKRATASGGSRNTLQCNDLSGPKDAWKGAQLWCAGGAAWYCWAETVSGYDDASRTLSFAKAKNHWYVPKKGSLFVLRGIRRALDAPGEWFYDTTIKRLLLIPPKDTDIAALNIEAKRRAYAIDLRERSHITIDGIAFRAAGLMTDKNSSRLVLKNMEGRYVAHSYTKDAGKYSVQVHGNSNDVLNCDFGYSSSSLLSIQGRDHRIINCNIHHGGYSGPWTGIVGLSGRRILFSHNTVRHSGRDLISTYGLMESLVQYNDVADSGWLTKDLGMFYGHSTDYANTVFRYNHVHDNHAAHCAMGIYFDHASHNAIVHHNVVWNAPYDPIRVNNPSYNILVFNNTCWNSGPIRSFDHSARHDMFASRYTHNILSKPMSLPKHVVQTDNHLNPQPVFRDPAPRDFRLKDQSHKDIGAYAPHGKLWKAGHDPKGLPDPLPVYQAPRIPWMNMVKNACFELGIEGWAKTDSGKAGFAAGNGWGNEWGKLKKGNVQATATCYQELKLGPGKDGVKQTITGLSPNTQYTLSAWMRVSGKDETVTLGVNGMGADEKSLSVSDVKWTRKSISFTTGPKATEATIYLRKSAGSGTVWCDNVTLPLTPNEKDNVK